MSNDTNQQADFYKNAVAVALKELTAAHDLMISNSQKTLDSFLQLTSKASTIKTIPVATKEHINRVQKQLKKIKSEYNSIYNAYRLSANKYALAVNANSPKVEENYKHFISSILETQTDNNQNQETTIKEVANNTQTTLQPLIDFINDTVNNGLAKDEALTSSRELLIQAKDKLTATVTNITKFSEEAINKIEHRKRVAL